MGRLRKIKLKLVQESNRRLLNEQDYGGCGCDSLSTLRYPNKEITPPDFSKGWSNSYISLLRDKADQNPRGTGNVLTFLFFNIFS